MVLYSEAQLAEYYDDNIFATENDKTSDYATVFSPHVFLVSDWQKHALSLQAHVDKTWYKDHTNENSTDYWVSGEGRIDAASDLQFFGGASYGRFHEDRASPDDANGFEPTLYQELKLYGSAWKRVGPHRFRGGATWERTTFDDTLTSTGTINNADRNRNHVTEGVADFYQLNDTFTPFVELGLDQRQYDTSRDDAGFDRDSHGYRTKVGTEFKVPGKVDGRVYVGYMRQNYEDAALPSISKPDFGGNFRWRFIPSTLLSGWVSRSIEETTLSGASGYVLTGGGATHRARSHVGCSAGCADQLLRKRLQGVKPHRRRIRGGIRGEIQSEREPVPRSRLPVPAPRFHGCPQRLQPPAGLRALGRAVLILRGAVGPYGDRLRSAVRGTG